MKFRIELLVVVDRSAFKCEKHLGNDEKLIKKLLTILEIYK